jgi:3-phytase/alkaline phosphatase D
MTINVYPSFSRPPPFCVAAAIRFWSIQKMKSSSEIASSIAVAACVVILSLAQADTGLSETVRFATFNASLNRDAAGILLEDLSNPEAGNTTARDANRIQQIHNVAEILQRIQADVLLVNEFDFDLDGTPGSTSTPMPLGYASQAAVLFQDNYLSASHGGEGTGRTATNALQYAYRYTPNTNTGVASGIDLDNNGTVGGGNDAFGFGTYAGQYGLTVYSKYPIKSVRTFQKFLWKDMPGNLLTNDPTTGDGNLTDYYSPEAVAVLRLSSKNHVDLVVDVDGQEVHFLVAHPTPPVFDGREDRNGKRNHDEIRFWKDYIHGDSYIYDDQGNRGGLSPDAKFVIAGDYNADPFDGDSYDNAIRQLLEDARINTTRIPVSLGGVEAASWPGNNGPANANHAGDPRFDTGDFNDSSPGNLRVDYVLPSANLTMASAGVFWPTSTDPEFPLVGTYGNPNLYAGFPSSDHRAVWVDITIVPEPDVGSLLISGAAVLALLPRRGVLPSFGAAAR